SGAVGPSLRSRRVACTIAALVAAGLTVLALTAPAAADPKTAFDVTRLTANPPNPAANPDENLHNGWGLDAGPTTPGRGAHTQKTLSTLYHAAGTPLPLVANVPGPPPGLVFNRAPPDFKVSAGGAIAPAVFLFDGGGGEIRGWTPGAPPPMPPATT